MTSTRVAASPPEEPCRPAGPTGSTCASGGARCTSAASHRRQPVWLRVQPWKQQFLDPAKLPRPDVGPGAAPEDPSERESLQPQLYALTFLGILAGFVLSSPELLFGATARIGAARSRCTQWVGPRGTNVLFPFLRVAVAPTVTLPVCALRSPRSTRLPRLIRLRESSTRPSSEVLSTYEPLARPEISGHA